MSRQLKERKANAPTRHMTLPTVPLQSLGVRTTRSTDLDDEDDDDIPPPPPPEEFRESGPMSPVESPPNSPGPERSVALGSETMKLQRGSTTSARDSVLVSKPSFSSTVEMMPELQDLANEAGYTVPVQKHQPTCWEKTTLREVPEKGTIKRYIYNFTRHAVWGSYLVVLTLIALFVKDIFIVHGEKADDSKCDIILLICFFSFFVDIVLSAALKSGYFLGFFFWCDALGTLSLLPDIVMFIALFPGAQESLGAGAVLRAGRFIRLAARATSLMRLLRIQRVLITLLPRTDRKEKVIEDMANAHSYYADEVSRSSQSMVARYVILIVIVTAIIITVITPEPVFPFSRDLEIIDSISNSSLPDVLAVYQQNEPRMLYLEVAQTFRVPQQRPDLSNMRVNDWVDLQYDMTYGMFSVRDENRLQALENITRTGCAIGIFLLATALMQWRVSRMFVQPLTKMTMTVMRLGTIVFSINNETMPDQMTEKFLIDDIVQKVGLFKEQMSHWQKMQKVVGDSVLDDNATDSSVPLAQSEEKKPQDDEEATDKGASRRLQVTQEIVDSEELYTKFLSILVQNYLIPLKSLAMAKRGVTREHISAVFANLEQLHTVHTVICRELVREHTRPPHEANIAKIYDKYAKHFKIYTVYVNNYEHCLSTVTELEQNSPEFRHFLEQAKRAEGNGGLDFMSYLIMPIQRIPRYLLLLNELLKVTRPDTPQAQSLKDALGRLQGIARYVNEKKRQVENVQKLIDLNSKIKRLPSIFMPLITHDRSFVDQRVMTLKKKSGRKITLLLFSNLLLLVDDKYTFQHGISMGLLEVQVSGADCFVIYASSTHSKKKVKSTILKPMLFVADSEAARDQYVKLLQDTVAQTLHAAPPRVLEDLPSLHEL